MGSALILASVTLGLWGLGFLLLGRLRPCKPAGQAWSGSHVSIVIPARNEEHNLPALLQSVAAQSVKPLEVLVVDDGSTDGTAEVAARFGARVLASRPLPEGWRGKTWALHQGAQATRGELLLFLDADTWFEPEGLRRILQAYPGGAFSVGPYHCVRKRYEDLSLFFNFNMTAGTVPDGLFGQMLLIQRKHYEAAGGHETVRGRTLENFWLAGRLRELGTAVQSATGRGVLSFRMYPNGLNDLVEGWTKGFAAGAGQTPRNVLLTIVFWMIGLMLTPLDFLLARHWPVWAVTYALCAVQVAWLSRKVGAFSWLSAVLFPVPLIFFFAVFGWSAARKGRSVTWKGREIRAD